jgi:predicted dehydrogenase
MDNVTSVRIGVLGAARVAPYALIAPARQTPGVEIDAVASRSLDRARVFASAHGVPRVFGSYEELLADAAIDAVYVALPVSLHGQWVARAIEAGKHVLCEKPLASNGDEAASLARAATDHGRVLLEGMHIRYMHRLERQRQIVASGELGRLRYVEACFRAPRIPMAADDFRLRADMGGGAAMDIGCYAASCLRFVADEEPEVRSVRVRTAAPGVDRWMRAAVGFPSGAGGHVECGFRGFYLPRMMVKVTCENGTVAWDKSGLVRREGGRRWKESLAPDWTFQRQLDAFLGTIRGECSDAVTPSDSVATARLLDQMYLRSGLGIRRAMRA